MSLIILPGEEKDTELSPLATPQGLIGRRLTLNTAKCRKFLTYKFYLGMGHPFDTVPPDADLQQIHQAVLDGRLIDVTDQHKTGLHMDGASMSPVQTEDIPDAPNVFIGVDLSDPNPAFDTRPLFIAVPKDKDEEAKFRQELLEKGRIDGVYNSHTPDAMLTGISVMDIEEEPPITSQEPGFWSLIVKAFRQLFKNFTHKFRR